MAIRVLYRFPGANVRVISARADGPKPEVVFTSEPHGATDVLWFHFRLDDPQPVQPPPATLTLTLRFFQNFSGAADPAALRPVMRVEDKSWTRLKAPEVSFLPDGQPLLSWEIDYPAARTEVALCYPYGRAEADILLQHSKGYWREEEIGLTREGRPLLRLDNGVAGQGPAAPRGLYLVARQHAGETPGSWVLDGLLEKFSRARNPAWCVWAVPFADIDGIAAGDYGRDCVPRDLDRAWGRPPARHESLVMRRDLERWRERCRPALVLDLRAPGASEADGVHACAAETAKPEEERDVRAWANHIGQELAPEYAAEPFLRPPLPGPGTTLSAFAHDELATPALAIETPYAICRGALMTVRHYREVGHRIAKAILGRWSS